MAHRDKPIWFALAGGIAFAGLCAGVIWAVL